jgi:hypothetical protein
MRRLVGPLRHHPQIDAGFHLRTVREYTARPLGRPVARQDRQGGAQVGRRHQPQLGARRVVRLQRARSAGRGRVALAQRSGPGSAPGPRGSARRDAAARARPAVQSMIVDSMPASQGPPSSTQQPAPNSSTTWLAAVGLMRPKRFALGPATPCTPQLGAGGSRACATGCEGMRRPMLHWPPAAAAATPGWRGTIRVSGPGQNAWPGSCTHRPRHVAEDAAAATRDMHDQRVVRRAALGGEDRATAAVVIGARAQTVHRLGRKGHQLATGQGLGGFVDGWR